ncbi:hypothetical protein [Rhizobium ruizarguesonis]|uniref:hypothetical protein n=1 Tax=Rhizobium ruizarguesonis TaxID=2081791 RepID=UPI001031803F|nr:hypothetical protein [Rhizobium ruizarguesonis]TBE20531.1 hypothetical protein ELH05_28145 [Rhizobium ruizarguesonis]TCA27783.1 hypothetical protein E0H66_31755 [Rhizobium leguminosarum bv. viciae]WSH23719.1 hypothetical protein U8Q07_25760 [Rhizobium ruizarguesonis]WSH37114.1 hypothetical protein U8P70_28600 [Rhizobium ruizarguesonis]
MPQEDASKSNGKSEKRKVCFVVGPIGATGSASRTHADWLLKGVILPTFKEHFREFDVVRSDRIDEPGMIDAQMIGHLLDAELVVADMSEHNANAFYEMGIRHMAALPIIHMFRKGTPIPFDVGPYRAIEFNYADPDDLEAAKVALRAAVDKTLKPGFKIENPVTRARGVQKISENATPEMQLLWQEVNALKKHLALRGHSRRDRDVVSVQLDVPGHAIGEVMTVLNAIVSVKSSRIEEGDEVASIFVSFDQAPGLDELGRIQQAVQVYGGSMAVLGSTTQAPPKSGSLF